MQNLKELSLQRSQVPIPGKSLIWNSCKSTSNCIRKICPFINAERSLDIHMDNLTADGAIAKGTVAEIIENMLEIRNELEKRLYEVEITLDKVLSNLPIPSKTSD